VTPTSAPAHPSQPPHHHPQSDAQSDAARRAAQRPRRPRSSSSSHDNQRTDSPRHPDAHPTGRRPPPAPSDHNDQNDVHDHGAPSRAGTGLAARLAAVDDPDIDAALDAIVAAAPPLPYPVRARLAWLLWGRHDTPPCDTTNRHETDRDRTA
jgi:hypothetical protein